MLRQRSRQRACIRRVGERERRNAGGGLRDLQVVSGLVRAVARRIVAARLCRGYAACVLPANRRWRQRLALYRLRDGAHAIDDIG